jgi:hypothetical protein
MEHLPYIDEHATTIPADRATAWAAVLGTMCRNPEDPTTVPFGFTLDVAEPCERFALKGHHWFSVYKLIFLLSDADGGTRVTAQTWADFPGLKGKAYRALVIGSGGHRIVVRRMLKRIAAQAASASMQNP